MARKTTLLLGLALLTALAGALRLRAAEPSAPRVAACTGVKNREPVAAASQFPVGVGQVWCFSEVRGAVGSVTHVWYRGGREVGRMSLPVQGERWRTWSHKTIPADWTGPWRVVVLDAQGREIGSVRFDVGGR